MMVSPRVHLQAMTLQRSCVGLASGWIVSFCCLTPTNWTSLTSSQRRLKPSKDRTTRSEWSLTRLTRWDKEWWNQIFFPLTIRYKNKHSGPFFFACRWIHSSWCGYTVPSCGHLGRWSTLQRWWECILAPFGPNLCRTQRTGQRTRMAIHPLSIHPFFKSSALNSCRRLIQIILLIHSFIHSLIETTAVA